MWVTWQKWRFCLLTHGNDTLIPSLWVAVHHLVLNTLPREVWFVSSVRQPRVALISKRRRLCIRDGRGILHKLHILLKGFVFKVFFRVLCFQNILDILEVTDWKYSWVVESLLNLPKALGSFGGEMNCSHWKQKTYYAWRFSMSFYV